MRDTTILIAKRFLFIGALTIPFDIRDFLTIESRLKNHPGSLGRKKRLPVLPGTTCRVHCADVSVQAKRL
jgi:hypothetical protein